jgi:hypothetical protein
MPIRARTLSPAEKQILMVAKMARRLPLSVASTYTGMSPEQADQIVAQFEKPKDTYRKKTSIKVMPKTLGLIGKILNPVPSTFGMGINEHMDSRITVRNLLEGMRRAMMDNSARIKEFQRQKFRAGKRYGEYINFQNKGDATGMTYSAKSKKALDNNASKLRVSAFGQSYAARLGSKAARLGLRTTQRGINK